MEEQLKLTEKQILYQARLVEKKYQKHPTYAANYIQALIRNNGYSASEEQAIRIAREIASDFQKKAENQLSPEVDLKTRQLEQDISRYYLKKKLVEGIIKKGEILQDPIETVIGVGFIDIADYSFLSKWLSPKENQVVLNGLYSAFNSVLTAYGGFLNKMEGDSLMFHYGGPIDTKYKNHSQEETVNHIARQLFLSCIEIQEICRYFNEADSRFFKRKTDSKTRKMLDEAFMIIRSLRENPIFSKSLNAFFQIQIRIGANIGEVSIGNFGPEGAKQWDIIGMPVIEARRMEATAPIGGFRFSSALYNILMDIGMVSNYYRTFKENAGKGYYRHIRKIDLFTKKDVILRDKKNAVFTSYSVQVNPFLPEMIQKQVEDLLNKEETGAEKVIEILKYYRGNRFIIQAIEDLFHRQKISLDFEGLAESLMDLEKNIKCDIFTKEYLSDQGSMSLFKMLLIVGQHQDRLKNRPDSAKNIVSYSDRKSFLKENRIKIKKSYEEIKEKSIKSIYFYNFFFPTFWSIIKSSILEYQHQEEELAPCS